MRFPAIPADLTSLSDADLTALHAECVAAYQTARPEATTPELVAELSGFAESFGHVRTEQATRAAAATSLDDTLAALDAQFSTTPPAEPSQPGEPAPVVPPAEPDPATPDPAVPPVEPAPNGGEDPEATLSATQIADLVRETVAASLPAQARRPIRASIADLAARVPAGLAPLPAPAARPFTITAAADVPGVPMGAGMDRRQLAEALIARHKNVGMTSGVEEERIPVATFAIDRGEARTLSDGDYVSANTRKVRDAIDEREAVVAAGGLCAPVNVRYDQPIISEAWRPVMGAFPQFTADRGGLRYVQPPALSDLTAGVGTITAAQDLAGGSGASKPAFAVTCPGILEVDVEADYVNIEFSNLGGKTFPENVEAWMALAAAKHARVADGNRLNDVKTGAPAETAAGLVGAGREILTRLEQGAQQINSAARRPHDAPVEVILPQWAISLIRADFTRTFTDDPALIGATDEEISEWLASRHLLVTLTPDTATGNGQVMAAPATGVIAEYAATVYAEMFVPGTYLGLDTGMLNLGLIRDSVLTSGSATAPGNRFRMFYENWEALAVVGPAGSRLELALAVCADGTYGAAKSVSCPIVT